MGLIRILHRWRKGNDFRDLSVAESDETEDLEGHGTAQYDRERKWWVVEFDELGVRYVPAGDRASVDTFLCVSCRRPLPISMPHEAFDPKASCASCGTSVLAPYAPPSLAT
jgi:hypothetical protein